MSRHTPPGTPEERLVAALEALRRDVSSIRRAVKRIAEAVGVSEADELEADGEHMPPLLRRPDVRFVAAQVLAARDQIDHIFRELQAIRARVEPGGGPRWKHAEPGPDD